MPSAKGSPGKTALATVFGLIALAACHGRPSGPPAARIGGPFHLVDQNGAARDQSMLVGHWSAVYFGYTFCPDTCPTTLTALAQAQKALGPKGRDFQVVFISVDPARDTPKVLKAYLANSAFPAGAVGLTGTAQAAAEAAKAYKVYVKQQGTGDAYSVDHTSVVYLMNPKGAFAAPIDAEAPPGKIATQLTSAMESG